GLDAIDGKHDRVERGGAADEEPVELRSTEDEIGDAFRNEDLAEQRSVVVEDVDAVPGAHPATTFGVEAKAVEAAVGFGGPDVAAGELAGVEIDIVDAANARLRGSVGD